MIFKPPKKGKKRRLANPDSTNTKTCPASSPSKRSALNMLLVVDVVDVQPPEQNKHSTWMSQEVSKWLVNGL